ncbi:hypothetical protein, partial [Moraxella catarrhalis]
VQGLFAAGDIRIFAPKQVVCAASDGATAALSVISYLHLPSLPLLPLDLGLWVLASNIHWIF